jgi:hypothetical protein
MGAPGRPCKSGTESRNLEHGLGSLSVHHASSSSLPGLERASVFWRKTTAGKSSVCRLVQETTRHWFRIILDDINDIRSLHDHTKKSDYQRQLICIPDVEQPFGKMGFTIRRPASLLRHRKLRCFYTSIEMRIQMSPKLWSLSSCFLTWSTCLLINSFLSTYGDLERG